MPPRKKEPADDKPVGRFYELRDQVAGNRRGAYRLTEDIAFPELTYSRVKEYTAAPTNEEKTRLLLGGHYEGDEVVGGHYDAVEALYSDRPIEEWQAFMVDVRAHYFGQGAQEIPGGSNGS